LECGAGDGFSLSSTLYLEEALGWTGVLVEPDPDNLVKLLAHKRNSWVAATCLSTVPKPQQSSFRRHQGSENRIWQMPLGRDDSDTLDILCVPINNLLEALQLRHIDYVRLDVVGFELDLLRTFPFANVSVTVNSFCSKFQILQQQ
jgi:FkbM family methyltransferase